MCLSPGLLSGRLQQQFPSLRASAQLWFVFLSAETPLTALSCLSTPAVLACGGGLRHGSLRQPPVLLPLIGLLCWPSAPSLCLEILWFVALWSSGVRRHSHPWALVCP